MGNRATVAVTGVTLAEVLDADVLHLSARGTSHLALCRIIVSIRAADRFAPNAVSVTVTPLGTLTAGCRTLQRRHTLGPEGTLLILAGVFYIASSGGSHLDSFLLPTSRSPKMAFAGVGDQIRTTNRSEDVVAFLLADALRFATYFVYSTHSSESTELEFAGGGGWSWHRLEWLIFNCSVSFLQVVESDSHQGRIQSKFSVVHLGHHENPRVVSSNIAETDVGVTETFDDDLSSIE